MICMDDGLVWGEIRSGLSFYRERLKAAFDAGIYENESAVLDGVARGIVDRIRERQERQNAQEAALICECGMSGPCMDPNCKSPLHARGI